MREPRGERRRLFDDVEQFCLFIGYPRSGHSLVGSILDAHPEVAMAHEADALGFYAHGFGRTRIFSELFENARRQAQQAGGRTQSGYRYEVPGQWQGRVSKLRVIGDKSGGESVRRLATDTAELRHFAKFIGLPMKLVHVVRNPFDTIARLSLVTRDRVPKRTLTDAVTMYEVRAVVNSALIEDNAFPILTIRHEDLVAAPHERIRQLCEFVGVEATDDYVNACAGIIWESPQRTRDKIEWPDHHVERVNEIIQRYDFFDGYSLAAPSQLRG